jgi:hypothetical protein
MPPNYGRYFNTLAGRPGAEAFNCELQASRDGQNVCFLETRCAVSAGEELLVDYGSELCDSRCGNAPEGRWSETWTQKCL